VDKKRIDAKEKRIKRKARHVEGREVERRGRRNVLKEKAFWNCVMRRCTQGCLLKEELSIIMAF